MNTKLCAWTSSSVEEGKSAEIVFEATRLEASIGWVP
jgi:hypothetical protein